MVRSHPPLASTTLFADMQTFPLPDVLEDLCSPANLRYQERSLLAQMDKRGIGTLSFVRASSEPVMVVIGQAQALRLTPQGSRFELHHL